VPTIQEIIVELVVILILAGLCSLLSAGLRWFFVHNRLLPPQKHRAVPWSGREVVLALFVPIVVSVVVGQLLIHLGFFDWVYGDNFLRGLKPDAPADLKESTADRASGFNPRRKFSP